MTDVIIKDPLRSAVEASSGGMVTVLYDRNEYPSYMNVIPRMNIEDVDVTSVYITKIEEAVDHHPGKTLITVSSRNSNRHLFRSADSYDAGVADKINFENFGRGRAYDGDTIIDTHDFSSEFDEEISVLHDEPNDQINKFIIDKDWSSLGTSESEYIFTESITDEGYPLIRIGDILPRANKLGSGPHPAFISRGEVKSELFIGQYLSSGFYVDDKLVPVSLPRNIPINDFQFQDFRFACMQKGPGWHSLTNWEWMFLYSLRIQDRFIKGRQSGNTDYGRSYIYPDNAGVRSDRELPGDQDGEIGSTLTGSGPISWRLNHDGSGIADFYGNLSCLVDGLLQWDGQIQMPEDNVTFSPKVSSQMYTSQPVYIYGIDESDFGTMPEVIGGNIIGELKLIYSTDTDGDPATPSDFGLRTTSSDWLAKQWVDIEIDESGLQGDDDVVIETRRKMMLAGIDHRYSWKPRNSQSEWVDGVKTSERGSDEIVSHPIGLPLGLFGAKNHASSEWPEVSMVMRRGPMYRSRDWEGINEVGLGFPLWDATEMERKITGGRLSFLQ
ncbi:MAG: hypothetical protein ACOCQD_00515 [archaeon]